LAFSSAAASAAAIKSAWAETTSSSREFMRLFLFWKSILDLVI
jgi:hypothetical protein